MPYPAERPSRTILLADDNEDSREIYGTLFEISGYRVMEAADGTQALEVAREHKPDIILLNLIMPGMSGHEVIRCLRDDPDTAGLRCLFLSGDARLEQMGRALMGGAEGYLTKPVEPRRVLEYVELLLSDETD